MRSCDTLARQVKPTTTPIGSDERIPIVDLVRLVSILLVFAVHLEGAHLTLAHASTELNAALTYVVRNGVYGVSMFFVVSGYVITRSVARRHPDLATLDLRNFYVRRASRILPTLLLSTALGIACLATFAVGKTRVPYCFHNPRAVYDAPFWISIFTFSFNWLRIARRGVTQTFGLHWDVLWSLAIEEQFYLVYPLALRALRIRRSIVLVLALIVAIGPCARMVSTAIDPGFLFSFTNSFVCFDLLAIGALLSFALEGLPDPAAGSPTRRAVEGAIGLAALGVLVLVYRFTFLGDDSDRAWAPTAIGLSVAVFLGAGIRAGWCTSRLMRAIVYPGQLSYGAYLLHPLVLFAAWRVVRNRTSFTALAIFAGLTLLVALVVYRAFEKPVSALVRRRFVRR